MVKILDTHLHLWNPDTFSIPWLEGETEILNRVYTEADYKNAMNYQGYSLEGAVYMEVDTASFEKERENTLAIEMVKNPDSLVKAAIIAGDLTSQDFLSYIKPYEKESAVKGVRQVLHVPQALPGICLNPNFIDNVTYLGKKGFLFEGCLRTEEQEDLYKLAKHCPETTIVVDHAGLVNPDLITAGKSGSTVTDYEKKWKENIEKLASLPNTVCKISGLNPAGKWNIETLRPAVDYCLEKFGQKRVLYASNYPVCNISTGLDPWILSLIEIVSPKGENYLEDLFYNNAKRIYLDRRQW